MQIVILAGGLGTRLLPLTRNIPKAMVAIDKKPFLEYQIELLKKNNIKDIVICAGYLNNKIRAYFSNGSKWGVSIRYSIERDKLLGTAGALKKAQKLLDDDFMVMYGDSYLPIDFIKVAKAYHNSQKPVLMTVYRNKNTFDKSNVTVEGSLVARYDKHSGIKMEYIDYGLSILNKKIISELPSNTRISLESIFISLVTSGRIAAYRAAKPFYEIGSPSGIERFRKYVRRYLS